VWPPGVAPKVAPICHGHPGMTILRAPAALRRLVSDERDAMSSH
jgi:hypothetical protein